jgi:hypothetical protein
MALRALRDTAPNLLCCIIFRLNLNVFNTNITHISNGFLQLGNTVNTSAVLKIGKHVDWSNRVKYELSKLCLVYIWKKHGNKETNQQKVLRRTNRLFSFDTTRTAKKTTPPTILRCNGNVFTEPLPSNDRRDTHTDTQTDGRGL